MFDYRFVLSLTVLRDILEPFNSLMIRLQKDFIHPFQVKVNLIVINFYQKLHV